MQRRLRTFIAGRIIVQEPPARKRPPSGARPLQHSEQVSGHEPDHQQCHDESHASIHWDQTREAAKLPATRSTVCAVRRAQGSVGGATPPQWFHAAELARLAGLHRSTVLQAVRRGEIRVSRTVGRSVRIAFEDAATFLASRGLSLPVAIAAPVEPRRIQLLTEQPALHRRFQEVVPAGWKLVPHRGLYDDLLTVGARPPAAVVVDLDVLGLNPLALLRALAADAVLGGVPVLAVSGVEAALPAALSHGARVALRDHDVGWRAAIAGLP